MLLDMRWKYDGRKVCMVRIIFFWKEGVLIRFLFLEIFKNGLLSVIIFVYWFYGLKRIFKLLEVMSCGLFLKDCDIMLFNVI